MENSQKHIESLGAKQTGKNKRKISFQQTIDVGNNIITNGRHMYPHSDYYELGGDEFKRFIQHKTGNKSNVLRPSVPVQVSAPRPPSQALYNALPAHLVQPITGNLLVDNSHSNLVKFPISSSMRNSQDILPSNIGNSGGNQFQPYPHQSQVFNNINVQYQPIIKSHEHYYPINGSNQIVNCFHSSQTNANNQLLNGFPSIQTNMANPSTSFNGTNQNFNVNNNNQLVNGFPYTRKSQEEVTRLQNMRPPPLSIVRPPIPVMVSTAIPHSQAPYNTILGNHVQSINCPPTVYNIQNNLVEFPMSAFMRNSQDPTMKFDYSRGNQFQVCPPQPQVFNNINAQYQPIIQSQEYYYPSNGSNQVVNGFPSTQTNVSNSSVTLNATNPTLPMNGSNQPVIGFSSSQTNVSNSSVTLNATNPTLPMNDSNQPVIGFSSSQTNDPPSPNFEFMLPSPKNNMNFLSPQSPYRPLLSPSLFSSPSSPEYPLLSHLVPDPPSPPSSSLFHSTTSSERLDYQ
ncbi:hypothetical protein MtrunA17_Chr4g0024071 [Medicago truncatula]|uniref:VQ domain-containing protein n=1 Tax=Medicago truncatula TaxID=3880 RepID=A0A072UUT4_MEDTR|nr:hypothetical protein MTR_4g046690 [Medicago truncatula]RHN60285.1 hypothetical protein MtrunA17_Chr4g0024071 [Medicago truncatula]